MYRDKYLAVAISSEIATPVIKRASAFSKIATHALLCLSLCLFLRLPRSVLCFFIPLMAREFNCHSNESISRDPGRERIFGTRGIRRHRHCSCFTAGSGHPRARRKFCDVLSHFLSLSFSFYLLSPFRSVPLSLPPSTARRTFVPFCFLVGPREQ